LGSHRRPANGTLAVTLLSGERRIAERTLSAPTRTLHGTFDTSGLQSGIYTLQARISTPPQHAAQTARRQVVVAPNPFVQFIALLHQRDMGGATC